MNDKNGLLDDRGQGQAAKDVLEQIKDRKRVFLANLFVERILFVHGAGFVVAPIDPHAVGIVDEKGKHSQAHLRAARTTIDEITVEKIVVIGCRISIALKDLKEVLKLSVDIANNGEPLAGSRRQPDPGERCGVAGCEDVDDPFENGFDQASGHAMAFFESPRNLQGKGFSRRQGIALFRE